MRKAMLGVAAVALGLLFIPAVGEADVADYVTASSETYTTSGLVAKGTLCPDGYTVISGGWRFTPDDGTPPTSLTVLGDQPWGTAPSMPSWWQVNIDVNEAGTLRVTAVCAID